MRFREGTRVVLLQDVRASGGAGVPQGARGIVKRSTGAVVIVRLDDGRTLPVKLEKLGDDSETTLRGRGSQ